MESKRERQDKIREKKKENRKKRQNAENRLKQPKKPKYENKTENCEINKKTWKIEQKIVYKKQKKGKDGKVK